MVLHDQHVHSKYSNDSNEDLKKYLDIANKIGCNYFVTTEHFDLDLIEFHDDWIADYESLNKELQILTNNYPNINMLLGIEVGYRKDKLDLINKKLNEFDFDVINLSIHDNEIVDFYWYKYFEKYGIENVMKDYFVAMIDATANFTKYNVLSHIDYGFKTIYLENKTHKISKYEEYLKCVFKNLIKNGKALEINTKVQEAINDDNHTKYILNLYKSMGGVKLTISSDAHSCERYRSSFEHYIKIIKECGFDHLVYFIKQKEHKFII